MSDHITEMTDENFEAEVLQADLPVLVDFWAPWCAPCKAITPILEEIAVEYGGRVKVAKVNVDDHPDTPAKFGVRGIPTLMVFKAGNVEGTHVGALSKTELVAMLDKHLA